VLTSGDNGTIALADRQRRYRGFIDVVPGGDGFRMVNQLNIEQYLRGMGEVRDPSWPQAALRTQAVAARTYALRAMAAAREICDSQRCQVYLGQQAEYGAMDKAVSATAGQVLLFGRTLASAVYSANAGGHSATREEGFGTTGGEYPYLRAAPYETKNPMPWSVTLNLSDVAARLKRPDATAVEVVQTGPSRRALSVALDGPSGRAVVTGRAFAAALGLRSTMFTVHMDVAESAVGPPAGGSTIQAPPDDVGADIAAIDASPPAVQRVAPMFALPDRPVPVATRVAATRTASTLTAFGALVLAVLLLVAASWRRPALVASLRSLRGVRRRAGDQP
jgi:SpoIID/LytB domain protein